MSASKTAEPNEDIVEDVWGLALREHEAGRLDAFEMEMLVDGRALGPFPHDLRHYSVSTMPEPERAILDSLPEPVLDIGCGTGRHVRYLQARGVECYGVDTSPACVEVARELGVRNVECVHILDWKPPEPLGAAIIMGGSLGILGDEADTRAMLGTVGSWIGDGGVLVASSIYDPAVRARRIVCPPTPRVDTLRFRLGHMVGPWTRFVAYEPEHASELLVSLGWDPGPPVWDDPLPEYCLVARRA